MMPENYKRLNNIVGWIVFLIATFVYVSTIEPTVSFWDCGEYIATAVKLQVGHPPGAPLFQLIGAFFAQFAFGDVMEQARMVNMSSALSSSFTILFLFWTITALARKIAIKNNPDGVEQSTMIAVFGAGVVGALAYTFSDSFWFSATEGEVYAMSSLFTAIAFWCAFKWDYAMDKEPKRAYKWLLLAAFVIGMSVGVHILTFLTIPAIMMMYFFRKYEKINTMRFIITNAIGVGILGFVFGGVFPIALSMFGKFELFFVNTVGLPFNTGSVIAFIVLVGAFVFGLMYTRKKNKPLWNTAVLAVMFMLMGYSSFITLAVRSNANTPIDENNPEDAIGLLAYYNREQYGDWPVMYGQYFNAPYDREDPFIDGKPVYVQDKEKGKYVISDDAKYSVRNWDSNFKGFFPRMWSDQADHVRNYKQIAGIKDRDIYNLDGSGKPDPRSPKRKPAFNKNMKFFFKFQAGHMYFRYFMWNFSGRQNDEQGRFEITKGNWMTGIPFLDKGRLGPQDTLPDTIKDNPGHNKYYMLPLILGLIGLYFHYVQRNKEAWLVTLLFFFTGLAVVLYTSQKPFEPRERDYAFVGSYYAFAIWIGLGVMGIYEGLKKVPNTKAKAIAISGVCLLLVPAIMAKENWDDHDRSGRYAARDMARNYLESCETDAILFTNGDNDTFPLWYAQEIEGVRRDVRVVNLSLLNTDWYIDQMVRATYEGKPVPFSLKHDQYRQGTRDVFYYNIPQNAPPVIKQNANRRWSTQDFMDFVKLDGGQNEFELFRGKEEYYYPTKKLRINVPKEKVLANGTVDVKDSAKVLDYIDWNLGGSALSKKDIMIIDLINNNNWERPIYFSMTVGNSASSFLYLDKYFQMEGLAYRLVPIQTPKQNEIDRGKIHTEKMYQNLMEDFKFGNMKAEGVYLDETTRRLSSNLRNMYGRLANALIAEGKRDKALEVLEKVMEEIPVDKFEHSYFTFNLIEAYYKLGQMEKARELMDGYADQLDQQLVYYKSFERKKQRELDREIRYAMGSLQQLVTYANQYDAENAPKYNQLFNEARTGL